MSTPAQDDTLKLLREAHGYVSRYASIGAQKLATQIKEHLARAQQPPVATESDER